MNYTVSCSGDVTCLPNFTTTDNTTRSYTITNLTSNGYYVFSVVATNSIGSGEAGVVTIGNPPNITVTPTPTTTPTTTTTTVTVASSVYTTTITLFECLNSSTSSQCVTTTTSSSSIETSSTSMITTTSS